MKGFGFLVVIVILIMLGVTGYYFFLNQNKDQAPVPTTQVGNDFGKGAYSNNQPNPNSEPDSGQGASYIPEAGRIQVVYPNGGEKLEVGKTYEIRWTNYTGRELLTIALQSTTPDNKTSSKIVASNVKATGSYNWTVTSENINNKYKIEIYPAGSRELVGRSQDYFSISGEQLITSVLPQPNARVNATQPTVITGKARKVFGEGEFDIVVSHIVDNQRRVLTKTFATCSITGNGCNWMSNDFLDFKATLDLSSVSVCYVSVEFFRRDEKTSQTQPFYVLPLWLYGNGSCR